MSKKPVTIRIINRVDNYLGGAAAFDEYEKAVRDEIEADGADSVIDGCGGDFFMGLGSAPEGEAPMVLETEGTVSEVNGAITLSYLSEITGAFPTKVEYRFRDESRDSLAVVKSSLFEEVYFFERRCRRQMVVYEAENVGVELSIYTKSLKNGITYENGGCLEVEYYAEIRGGIVEHCREYVIVEPLKEDKDE